MLCSFKKGKKDLCSVWKAAITDSMCQKWFVKFPAGNYSLDNASQLSRPVEVDSDQDIN